jgi:peptide/nickel transport system substrate-binding protein
MQTKRALSCPVLFLLSVALLLPLVVGACGPSGGSAETLVVLIDNDEGPITPANFNTFIGWWMIGWVYDPLFARSPDLIPVPALATEANQSADGLSWAIKLRDDVKWHDGEPFTAEDVIFSYNWLVEAGRAPALSAIDSMEADGDYALTIRLSEPSPFFLDEGLAGYYVMPEHVWRDQEPVSGELSQFQGKIGTGPFRLGEIVPGESYTFEANPDYFRGKPRVQNLIAKIVKDRTQQFNQLKAGTASAVLSSVPPSLVGELGESPDIELSKGSDFFNYVFYANGSRPPFDNPDVRRAISLAIDADKLVETVMLGQGTLLPHSYYHPDLPWATNISGEFDPEAAQALLDEAGVVDSDGDGIREFEGEPTDYEILCDVNNTVEVRSTELIAGMLEDVGIQAKQRCMDIDTAVTYIWPSFVAVPDPDYDLAIWGWSSGTQFQRGFLRFLTNCDLEAVGWANLTGTCDPVLDELEAEYVSNPDLARQEDLSRQIQEQFAETLVFIPLMSPDGNFAYRQDDYDGWVYVKGTGIMPAWSYLPADAAE